jgi:hypothetical protein
MPIFARSEGVPTGNLGFLRQMMPYLLPGRNESAVLIRQEIHATPSSEFLAEVNRTRPEDRPGTQFHLVLRAIARALYEFPRLNRFVVGGRHYDRKGVWIAFTAKVRFDLEAPIFAVKMPFPEGEPLGAMIDRIYATLGEGRSGRESRTDKEVKLFLRLPGPLRRLVVRAGRWLDAFGLLPATMIAHDPMYSSAFVANLGSVGLDAAYHHLYEYGTTPVFVTMGRLHRAPFVREDGSVTSREVFVLKCTYDERTEDGFYCARALERLRYLLEHPGEL